MPLGTPEIWTGQLGWDVGAGRFRLDLPGGGYWLLDGPRRARRLLGQSVTVHGWRSGFNWLDVDRLVLREPAGAPRGIPRMDGPLEWFGALGAIVAAGLIAADLGRRITGWAFVLFLAVSLAWVTSGLLHHTWPLVAQNGLLLAINGWGVWQYLLDPRRKRVIERQEALSEQAEAEVDRAGRPDAA